MSRFAIARQKASEVLRKLEYSIDEMIRTNDVIRAVEEMLDVDIKFTKRDFVSLAKTKGMGKALSDCGAMMRVTNDEGKRKAYILLNAKETPEMVRFSLVHELGHLVTMDWSKCDPCHISTHIDMDITSIPESALQKPQFEFLIEEQVANVFALLVLIPYNSLLYAMQQYDTIEDVADFFGVEKSAVLSRLMLETKEAG